MSIEEEIEWAIGGVVWNAANYPEPAQSRILGADIGPLREKITAAVMPLVKRAQAEALREAADRYIAEVVKGQAGTPPQWLRARADRIENEGAGA